MSSTANLTVIEEDLCTTYSDLCLGDSLESIALAVKIKGLALDPASNAAGGWTNKAREAAAALVKQRLQLAYPSEQIGSGYIRDISIDMLNYTYDVHAG